MNNNYLIFNDLGILDLSDINEVSQGNHNVDYYFVGYHDYDYTNSYVSTAVTLPDGTNMPELATSLKEFEFNGVKYKGFMFKLPETLTSIAGNLTITMVLSSLEDDTQLCSSQVNIPIHATDTPTEPTITNAQYDNMMETITENFNEIERKIDAGMLKGDKGDKGDKGEDGEAATIEVDGVVTLQYGNPAQVLNYGDNQNARFRFYIPEGKPGATGTTLQYNSQTGYLQLLDFEGNVISEVYLTLDNPKTEIVYKGEYTYEDIMSSNAVEGDLFYNTDNNNFLLCIKYLITESNVTREFASILSSIDLSDYSKNEDLEKIQNNTTKIHGNYGGGSVGADSEASYGFAGGKGAKADAYNSIQLGEGTNVTSKTLQVYDDNIYDATSHTGKFQNITLNGEDLKDMIDSKQESITIDSQLSTTSTNPIQNKSITYALTNGLDKKLDKSSYVVDSNLDDSSNNPIANSTVSNALSTKSEIYQTGNSLSSFLNLENKSLYIILLNKYNEAISTKVVDVSSLASIEELPTKVSELINDLDFATIDFVNSSIATNTATFRGTYNSVNELPTTGVDINDYAFVITTDENGNTAYNRYKFTTTWEYEYKLNNSSFTASQWEAINSGITSYLVTLINTNNDWKNGFISSTFPNLLNRIENDETRINNIDSVVNVHADLIDTNAQNISENTNSISNLQTNKADASELINLTSRVETNENDISNLKENKANSTDLNNYLPLTAGSEKKLTGDLYVQDGTNAKNIYLGKTSRLRDNGGGGLIISTSGTVYLRSGGDGGTTTGLLLDNTVFRPQANEGNNLGTASSKWKEIHGTTIYQDGKQVANKEDIPTVGAAASKGVVTTIDTSANLPTSNAVKTFVEGKGYITSAPVTSVNGQTGEVVIDIPDVSGLATTTYVNEKVADLVNSAPETLDTLGEVATAIAQNETVVEALNSAIGSKANTSDLSSYLPLSGGTMEGPLVLTGGDAASGVGNMQLDTNGQITAKGTDKTLFGRNSATNLLVGHSSHTLTMRGSATRPTYNGSNMALYSDIPTIVTLTQAEYDALATKNANTYYFIKEE